MSSGFFRSDFKRNGFSILKFVTFTNLCAIIQMTDNNGDIHVTSVVWTTGMHWFNRFELLFTVVNKTVTTEKTAPTV